MDRLHLLRTCLAETFQDFVHFRLGGVFLPIRVRCLVEMVVDAVQATVEFDHSLFQLFFALG